MKLFWLIDLSLSSLCLVLFVPEKRTWKSAVSQLGPSRSKVPSPASNTQWWRWRTVQRPGTEAMGPCGPCTTSYHFHDLVHYLVHLVFDGLDGLSKRSCHVLQTLPRCAPHSLHMTSLSLSILPSQIQILPFFCHSSAIFLPFFCHFVMFISFISVFSFFPHFVSMSPETRSKLTRPNTTVENCQQWAVDNRCTAISCDIQGNHVGNHVVKHWSHSLLLFILRWLQGNLVISISPIPL